MPKSHRLIETADLAALLGPLIAVAGIFDDGALPPDPVPTGDRRTSFRVIHGIGLIRFMDATAYKPAQ
jgi:hypothetical protein